MKRKPIQYRQSYLFNPVTLGLAGLLLVAGMTLWSAAPSLLVRVESNRILESTAEKFRRDRPQYLQDDKALDRLHLTMKRNLYAAEITDPDMEAWIEIDEQGHAHLGVIYDQATNWPFGIAEPTVFTVKQKVVAKPE